jgi:C_GCAxxG_C_C family probable redox protein
MMKRIMNAVDKFHDEYACSQAILTEYGALYCLEQDTALKLASGFAGGMRMGKMCGAVTGAFMVLGLAFGGHNCGKMEGRERVYNAVLEFTKNFREKYGTVSCSDLLGHDISTKQGIEAVKEQNLIQTMCPKFVKTSAELLEQVIEKR